MLAISTEDINQLLDWPEVVETIGQAFAALSAGQANIPLRTSLPIPQYGGLLLTMPGLLTDASNPNNSGLAVKMVNVFNGNPARQLPLIYGLVVLFEVDTGKPLALFDGGRLTAIRTGAASGIASKLLARPDSKILALFGAGVQAETQLQAVCAVRDIAQIRVYSRSRAKAEIFCGKMQDKLQIPVTLAATPETAVANADIIITATTSTTPVFADANIPLGTHINGVGSYAPAMREIPGETISRAVVVVDAREGALAEAGDLLIPLREGQFEANRIYAEIGEIYAGTKLGRETLGNTAITVFKSVGNAVQDVALARYFYAKAQMVGAGQKLEL